MDDAAQHKRVLRRAMRARRAARTAEQRAQVAAGLLATALSSAGPDADALRAARVVAAYVAVPGEPDVGRLRTALRERGTTVLLPVVGAGHHLAWGLDDGLLHPGAPHPGGLVIDEPVTAAETDVLATADVVLVPATAVDRAGVRLGQGGGYYDRALAELERRGRRPLLVAVVHDDEVLPAGDVPAMPHDRRVDAVLTPTRWVDTTSGPPGRRG